MRCLRRGPKGSRSRLQDSTFVERLAGLNGDVPQALSPEVSVALATSKLASKRIGITLTFIPR
jgi:hypothetical protein